MCIFPYNIIEEIGLISSITINVTNNVIINIAGASLQKKIHCTLCNQATKNNKKGLSVNVRGNLPIMWIYPDKLIGTRDIGIDGFQRGVADEARGPVGPGAPLPPVGHVRARAQAGVGAGGGVRAQGQLLDGEANVLEATSAGPGHLQLKVLHLHCAFFSVRVGCFKNRALFIFLHLNGVSFRQTQTDKHNTTIMLDAFETPKL